MTITPETIDQAIAARCQTNPEVFLAKALADADWPSLDVLCRIHHTRFGINAARQEMLVQQVATAKAAKADADAKAQAAAEAAAAEESEADHA